LLDTTNEVEKISSFYKLNHYMTVGFSEFEYTKQLEKKYTASIGAMGHAARCSGL
jgi:hypothetical protein